MARVLVIHIFLFLSNLAFAQTPALIDSLKEALPSQNGKSRVDVLNWLCREYRFINADSARKYGRMSLNLADKIDYKEGLATASGNLGVAFEAQGNFDSAITYHERSLVLKEDLRDTLEIAGTLNNLGIANDELGNHLVALEYYFQALKYYEEKEEPLQMAKVYSNIGVVYRKQKEYDNVLEYYMKAYNIYREEGSEFGQAVLQGNIGVVYINLKDYEQAKSYSQQSLAGYTHLGLKQYIPYALFNTAIVYDSLHVADSAEYLYLQAIEEFKDYNNQHELANTYAHLSKFYLKVREYDKGISFGQKAVDIAHTIGARDIELRAMETLANGLAASGSYDQGFSVLKEHNRLKDTLFESSKTKQILELQTRYETADKEREIATKNLELSQMNAVIERNTLLLTGLGLTIILLVVIGFLLKNRMKINEDRKLQQQKTRSKAEQLNAVITSQEEERKRFAMDLHDGFGQFISALKMNLSRLENLARNQFDQRDAIVLDSENVLRHMHTEIRNVAFNLMPTTLSKEGLIPALKEFAERLNRTGKIVVAVYEYEMPERLTNVLEVSLYRVVQEWVNNVLKYANANKIEIQVLADDGEVRISMEDDGHGFDVSTFSRSKGHGWRNINSRLNLIQGEIDVDSSPGRHGTSVFITAPMIEADRSEQNSPEVAESTDK